MRHDVPSLTPNSTILPSRCASASTLATSSPKPPTVPPPSRSSPTSGRIRRICHTIRPTCRRRRPRASCEPLRPTAVDPILYLLYFCDHLGAHSTHAHTHAHASTLAHLRRKRCTIELPVQKHGSISLLVMKLWLETTCGALSILTSPTAPQIKSSQVAAATLCIYLRRAPAPARAGHGAPRRGRHCGVLSLRRRLLPPLAAGAAQRSASSILTRAAACLSFSAILQLYNIVISPIELQDASLTTRRRLRSMDPCTSYPVKFRQPSLLGTAAFP